METPTNPATGASATVIAYSKDPASGSEVATVEVRHHRFVLAEFNTHGHAKSSTSSRAIPVAKQLHALLEDIAYPFEFGTAKPGMQAGPPLSGDKLHQARLTWARGALRAIETSLELFAGRDIVTTVLRDNNVCSLLDVPFYAKRIVNGVLELAAEKPDLALNVHKQIANRPLEPYMWHTSVHTAHVRGTGSSWENLFRQRCSPTDGSEALAQPEFYMVADLIRTAIERATPRELGRGEAHTPYLQGVDFDEFEPDLLAAISIARCARTSYQNQAGVRDPIDDLAMFM